MEIKFSEGSLFLDAPPPPIKLVGLGGTHGLKTCKYH